MNGTSSNLMSALLTSGLPLLLLIGPAVLADGARCVAAEPGGPPRH